jgi:polysaccharide pyruvyl transferase WcaK-like protein
MNANELADLVECACCAYQKEAAAMLRQFDLAESIIKQQQLEIEALRNQLWDLKSEPWGFDRHPVKELTDEEILELWVQKNNLNGASDILEFARAILRKAQEK